MLTATTLTAIHLYRTENYKGMLLLGLIIVIIVILVIYINYNTTNEIILFYSPTCGPCQRFMPKWEKAVSSHSDQSKFKMCQVETSPEMVKKYNIDRWPTVIKTHPFWNETYDHKSTIEEFIK